MINKKYQSIQNAIASYNFVDIAAGTGIINFYAGTAASGSYLSNSRYYSDEIYETAAGGVSGVKIKAIDKDFDVYLNRPLNIGGKCVVNVPVSSVGSNSSSSIYVIVKFRKWNGTTETEIVQNQSSTYNVGGSSVQGYKVFAVDLNIPQTFFKIGEYIRLTIEVWQTGGGAGGGTAGLAYDPMNRAYGTLDTTSLIFQVPIKIDVELT